MIVRFWGTRGSIPVGLGSSAVKDKLVTALLHAGGRTFDTPDEARRFVDEELDFAVSHTFGGESSCVEIDTGSDEYVLCDLGSGARVFGNHVLAAGLDARRTFHVFMSHLHWDHIMGFPFFMPAYLPGNRIHVCGGKTRRRVSRWTSPGWARRSSSGGWSRGSDTRSRGSA